MVCIIKEIEPIAVVVVGGVGVLMRVPEIALLNQSMRQQQQRVVSGVCGN